MKEYRGSEVFKTPITSNVAYEGLDLGIEPLSSGVGDWIYAIIEKAVELSFDYIRRFGQRAELKPMVPASPVVEERQSLASIAEALCSRICGYCPSLRSDARRRGIDRAPRPLREPSRRQLP